MRIKRRVEWRPVLGYAGIYSIARDGRVWAHPHTEDRGRGGVQFRKGKWLKPSPMGLYLGVHLYRDDRRQNFYIHHLVMAAWGPSQPSPSHEINHRDFDRHNNHIDNLEWLTRTENIQHAIASGSKMVAAKIGSAVHNAKLTEAQVREIRARYTGKRGEQSALAREFGVKETYIWSIINRVTWKHI